jgi:hypothetical protein
MDTANIFICLTCGLPIRDTQRPKDAAFAGFTCPNCVVCKDVSQTEMDRLEKRMLDLIMRVMKRLYTFQRGKEPSTPFLHAFKARILQRNDADKKIDAIKNAIAASASDDVMLCNVAASEKLLSGFFYSLKSRENIINSETVQRHWVAFRKTMALHSNSPDPEKILADMGDERYRFNLERLSRLIGDNPVCISRDPALYQAVRLGRKKTRAHHLLVEGRNHIRDLIDQTNEKDMYPKIVNYDLEGLLRFAGNACFITEPDQVVEFRATVNDYLCKYLLKDQIMILIDDLWFTHEPAPNPPSKIPPAELVTIYPHKLAADDLMKHIGAGNYVPNCLDLEELTTSIGSIEERV